MSGIIVFVLISIFFVLKERNGSVLIDYSREEINNYQATFKKKFIYFYLVFILLVVSVTWICFKVFPVIHSNLYSHQENIYIGPYFISWFINAILLGLGIGSYISILVQKANLKADFRLYKACLIEKYNFDSFKVGLRIAKFFVLFGCGVLLQLMNSYIVINDTNIRINNYLDFSEIQFDLEEIKNVVVYEKLKSSPNAMGGFYLIVNDEEVFNSANSVFGSSIDDYSFLFNKLERHNVLFRKEGVYSGT